VNTGSKGDQMEIFGQRDERGRSYRIGKGGGPGVFLRRGGGRKKTDRLPTFGKGNARGDTGPKRQKKKKRRDAKKNSTGRSLWGVSGMGGGGGGGGVVWGQRHSSHARKDKDL